MQCVIDSRDVGLSVHAVFSVAIESISHHQEDFGLLAEWNFFATSHGKTACDGIEGTAKRLTLKASLQRPVHNQIITPRDMFSFCSENISGILAVP